MFLIALSAVLTPLSSLRVYQKDEDQKAVGSLDSSVTKEDDKTKVVESEPSSCTCANKPLEVEQVIDLSPKNTKSGKAKKTGKKPKTITIRVSLDDDNETEAETEPETNPQLVSNSEPKPKQKVTSEVKEDSTEETSSDFSDSTETSERRGDSEANKRLRSRAELESGFDADLTSMSMPQNSDETNKSQSEKNKRSKRDTKSKSSKTSEPKKDKGYKKSNKGKK